MTILGPSAATLILGFATSRNYVIALDFPTDYAYCIKLIAQCYFSARVRLQPKEVRMSNPGVFERIKRAIDSAPRNCYVAELHLQVIKHADLLEGVSGKEFCEKLDLKPAWGTEFAKMRKIAGRLREAGLQPERI